MYLLKLFYKKFYVQIKFNSKTHKCTKTKKFRRERANNIFYVETIIIILLDLLYNVIYFIKFLCKINSNSKTHRCAETKYLGEKVKTTYFILKKSLFY